MAGRHFFLHCCLLGLLMLAAGCAPSQPSSPGGDRLEDIRAYLRISERLATSGQIEYDQIKNLRDAGYEVVINLAIADERRNASEGYLVTQQGMAYFHIPVSFQQPALGDLDLFFGLMEAVHDKKIFVHCFANMRVSVFVYLYRTLQLGEPEEVARKDMQTIWDPSKDENWAKFIEDARARKDGVSPVP